MTNIDKEDSLYTRTEMLLGADGIERLRAARVIVFGIGGVGGYAVEALARAGVGELALVDADKVSVSNLNRQIIATEETVGMDKTEAARQRVLSINPLAKVDAVSLFYSSDTAHLFNLGEYDYVIDAIDTVTSKLDLITNAKAAGARIISCMGTGNKLDPTRFRVTDISKTATDPLARVVRTELRRRGINHLKVVFSDEPPINPTKKRVPGSVSFVPSIAGLVIASEVIKDIALSTPTAT